MIILATLATVALAIYNRTQSSDNDEKTADGETPPRQTEPYGPNFPYSSSNPLGYKKVHDSEHGSSSLEQ